MGFLNTVMDIGQAIGPIATGVIVGTSLGCLGGFWFMGLVRLVASVIFSVMFIGRREPGPEPTCQFIENGNE